MIITIATHVAIYLVALPQIYHVQLLIIPSHSGNYSSSNNYYSTMQVLVFWLLMRSYILGILWHRNLAEFRFRTEKPSLQLHEHTKSLGDPGQIAGAGKLQSSGFS